MRPIKRSVITYVSRLRSSRELRGVFTNPWQPHYVWDDIAAHVGAVCYIRTGCIISLHMARNRSNEFPTRLSALSP
jgi:hypothetical protein